MSASLEELLGQSVSRETSQRLGAFGEMLIDEAGRQNLIAASTKDDYWTRHILDSGQLVRFAPRPDSTWLDIGSGAGLPGIVIAILTNAPVKLVEPRRLRADFLQRCATELHLHKVTIEQAKVQAVQGAFDVITARAVADLTTLFEIATHLSHAGTKWLLPKGRTSKSELDEARQTWQGEFRLEASVTDPDASIVLATGVRRRVGAGGRR